MKPTPTTNKPAAENDRRGSVVVDGVTITWDDGRYMAQDADDPSGDWDQRGAYQVKVSITDGEIGDVNNAIAAAKRLKMLAQFGPLICPVPGSTHVLKLAGLDRCGCPRWRVIFGERECDAIPASQLAMMEPRLYANTGEVGMRTIAWMRQVGQTTSAWPSQDEAWRAIHTAPSLPA